jgi:release factor glutamine methyltransferase
MSQLLFEAMDSLKPIVGNRALHEARLLLAHVSGKTEVELIQDPNIPLSAEQKEAFAKLIERRKTYEPIAYLLGKKEFYNREFEVNPCVLIPRPETEELIDEIVKWVNSHRENTKRILDLGTGSGCIILSLAAELGEGIEYVAVDISPEALEVAKRNADRLKIQANFQEADICKPGSLGQFDLIVSNPPYIPEREKEVLSRDVKDFEPHHALFAEGDGMGFFHSIFENWLKDLRPGGLLALETSNEGQRRELMLELAPEVSDRIWERNCHLLLERR